MPRTAINSAEYSVPIKGFSQLLRVQSSGELLFLSGLTARSADGTIVALNDMAGQVEQIMKMMSAILATAEATMDDVIQIRTFTTDIERWHEIEPVWARYWGETWPVSTMVQVSRLFHLDQLIEMEAIAQLS